LNSRSAGLKRNAVTRRIGPLVILLQGRETPTDAEWSECIRLLATTEDINTTKVLVVTDGGGPNLGQRQTLEKVLRDTKVCSAVVSDSVKVRFIVATVALFSTRISTFALRELPKAYDYLGLSTAQIAVAEKALAEMRRALE
jgi:hypothetical protein